MKERPILFSTEMVQEILAGRKTQTRRVVLPSNSLVNGNSASREQREFWNTCYDWVGAYVDPGPSPAGNPGPYLKAKEGLVTDRIYPRWSAGDRLWVRESWNATSIDGVPWKDPQWEDLSHKLAFNWNVRYKATPDHEGQTWLSARFMPKKFARIWLNVTNVRVERIQDISVPDQIGEGIIGTDWVTFDGLWDSINAKRGYGWDVNPWVWVIEFTHDKGVNQEL